MRLLASETAGTLDNRFACLGHSLVIAEDGSLWAWGPNGNGQLGDGTLEDKASPVRVAQGVGWTQVALAVNTSYAVRSDGSLWGWGDSSAGQLGRIGAATNSTPVELFPGTKWTAIHAGLGGIVAGRTDAGTWRLWGPWAQGQVVDVPQGLRWQEAAVGQLNTVALGSDGSLWDVYLGVNVQGIQAERIGVGSAWRSVTAGYHAAGGVFYALDRSGGLHWRYGIDNILKPLGTGWTSFRGAAGIDGDGALWIDGNLVSPNSPQLIQLGTGQVWRAATSQLGIRLLAVSAEGLIYEFSLRSTGSDPTHSPTFANTRDVQSRVVGTDDDWRSASAGGRHTVAIKRDGSLWTWGDGSDGALGLGLLQTSSTRPINVPSNQRWSETHAGQQSTLGLTMDGLAFGWGRLLELLGRTDLPGIAWGPVEIRADVLPAESFGLVARGDNHVLEVTNVWTQTPLGPTLTKAMLAWGTNDRGQLGDASVVSRK